MANCHLARRRSRIDICRVIHLRWFQALTVWFLACMQEGKTSGFFHFCSEGKWNRRAIIASWGEMSGNSSVRKWRGGAVATRERLKDPKKIRLLKRIIGSLWKEAPAEL